MRRAGVIAAVAAVMLLALTGCTPGSPAAEPTAWGAMNPMNPPTHPHIARYCPNEPADHFDGDPEAFDTVYVCTVEDVPPSQNGLPRTKQTADRIAPDAVAALLTAYSAPDAKPTDDACAAMMADPLVIWIVEGDDTVAVRAPVGGCGFPTDEATKAFQDAPRETILVAREADIDG
jgi:hypothetical protein